jgi:uncharacterized protein
MARWSSGWCCLITWGIELASIQRPLRDASASFAMNASTQRRLVAGPTGALEVAVDDPMAPTQVQTQSMAPRVAVICHPHPQHGGTLDNKVVQTIARAFVQVGWRAVRFNVRGVGQSEGVWDEGRGEVDDALAVLRQAELVPAGSRVALAGFSFGAFVAASAAKQWLDAGHPLQPLVLVGPATSRFSLPPVDPASLIIHGETDDVVPLAHTLDWARPQGLPVVVVPGVGHFFHGQLPGLKAWVMRHVAAWDAPT